MLSWDIFSSTILEEGL